MADGESADHEISTPMQNTSGSGPTYAQTMLLNSSNTVSPPAAIEKLVYDDIQAFKNQQVQTEYTSTVVPSIWHIVA